MDSFTEIFNWVISHSYTFIFIAMVIEGPVVTFAAAFAAHAGFLNIWIIFSLAMLGDVVGDIIYYWIGRFGREAVVEKFGKKVGLTRERILNIEEHIKNHKIKTIIVMKMTPLLAGPGLMIVGAARVPFIQFILISLSYVVPSAIFFAGTGYLFGSAYQSIFKFYNWGIGLAVAVVAGFILFKIYKYFTNIVGDKIENLD